jgi:hypothetical protein
LPCFCWVTSANRLLLRFPCNNKIPTNFFKYLFYIFNIHIYLFSSTELGDDETLVDKVGVLLIRSKLHYACIIWQPHHNIQAAKLEQIIRKFLKYLYLRDVGEYPPIGIAQTYLLNRFDCVSFATSCKKALAIFAFKLLHNILDCSEILSQLAFNAGSRGMKSRHYRLFYLP